MRFVETKTSDQQSGLVLHRTRHLCMRQQTSVINAIRAHLAEFGVVAPVGRRVSRSYSMLSPIQMISGCPKLRGCASWHLGLNCVGSRNRFWSSTG
jgi:hypothetical protein